MTAVEPGLELPHTDHKPHPYDGPPKAELVAMRKQHRVFGRGSLEFMGCPNRKVLAYLRRDDRETILIVVNLDPHHTQSGWVEVPIHDLGIAPDQPFQVHDLLTDARYLWHGAWNYVELNPHAIPAHIFRVIRDLRTEKNFEYYM